MKTRNAFVAWARERTGCVVLWQGKGDYLFDLEAKGGLREHHFGQPVYDCSGFYTCGLHAVGVPKDRRATHSAQVLHDEMRPLEPGRELPLAGDGVFFGVFDAKQKLHVIHIAIYMPDGGILSADGARSSQLSFETALKDRGSRIRLHDRARYRGEPYFSIRRAGFLDEADGLCL